MIGLNANANTKGDEPKIKDMQILELRNSDASLTYLVQAELNDATEQDKIEYVEVVVKFEGKEFTLKLTTPICRLPTNCRPSRGLTFSGRLGNFTGKAGSLCVLSGTMRNTEGKTVGKPVTQDVVVEKNEPKFRPRANVVCKFWANGHQMNLYVLNDDAAQVANVLVEITPVGNAPKPLVNKLTANYSSESSSKNEDVYEISKLEFASDPNGFSYDVVLTMLDANGKIVGESVKETISFKKNEPKIKDMQILELRNSDASLTYLVQAELNDATEQDKIEYVEVVVKFEGKEYTLKLTASSRQICRCHFTGPGKYSCRCSRGYSGRLMNFRGRRGDLCVLSGTIRNFEGKTVGKPVTQDVVVEKNEPKFRPRANAVCKFWANAHHMNLYVLNDDAAQVATVLVEITPVGNAPKPLVNKLTATYSPENSSKNEDVYEISKLEFASDPNGFSYDVVLTMLDENGKIVGESVKETIRFEIKKDVCDTKFKLKDVTYSEINVSGLYSLQFHFELEKNSDIPTQVAMIIEIKDCNGNKNYISITLKYDSKTGGYFGGVTLKQNKDCPWELAYGEIAAYNECKDKTVWSFDASKAKGNGLGTKNASSQASTKPRLL